MAIASFCTTPPFYRIYAKAGGFRFPSAPFDVRNPARCAFRILPARCGDVLRRCIAALCCGWFGSVVANPLLVFASIFVPLRDIDSAIASAIASTFGPFATFPRALMPGKMQRCAGRRG